MHEPVVTSPVAAIEKWRAELERIFTPRQGLSGLGTPELKRLVADALGKESVSEGEFSRFLLDLAQREDASISDVAVRAEQRALAVGACGWLFVPGPTEKEYQRFFPADENGIRESDYDSMGMRQAWAYYCYQRATLVGARQQRYVAHLGRGKRSAFRDALLGAVERRFEIGAVGTSADDVPFGTALEQLLARITGRVDGPATSYYPSHLTPRRLAIHLRVEPWESHQREVQGRQWFFEDSIAPGRGKPAPAALATTHRAVILGDPGSGKSTIGLAWIADALSTGVGGVFVRAAELAQRTANASGEGADEAQRVILDAFSDWLGSSLTEEVRSHLRDQLSEPGTCLLIDGVDEIDEPKHRDAFDRLMRRIDLLPARVVVTTRVAGYRRLLPDAEELFVLPLSNCESRRVLDEWFPESGDAHARATAFADSPPHSEAAANPLTLGLVALASSTDDPPETIGELFALCTRHFLSRVWKPAVQRRGDDFAVEAAHAVLKQLIEWAAVRRADVIDYLPWGNFSLDDELSDFLLAQPWHPPHLMQPWRREYWLNVAGER
ncbi:MAG TPA: NACHT domain-containing protein [Pseudolysinimonas sp.]|jgi:hypothetical protein|nr:NACHT domain-containing protein [Pseudolysinimonas sp.]